VPCIKTYIFSTLSHIQVKQQNSTSAKVTQMFELIFDAKTDKEQRLQVWFS
jgi:hypothetical protein